MFSKNLILFIFVTSLLFVSVIGGKKPRLVGANMTEPGQFSYTVAIVVDRNIFICGGGIIGIKWILTAARCVISVDFIFAKELMVVIGTNDFKEPNEPERFEVPVDTAYIPSDYNAHIRKADIAVLRLSESIFYYPTSYRLKRLHLPKNNSTIYNVDLRAVVSGFGAKDESLIIMINSSDLMNPDVDGKLRAAPVKIVTNDEYKKIPNRKWNPEEYQFLAKIVKRSSTDPYGLCYADIGNPLVYDSQTIIGIVIDISDSCDEREHPSMYTKVVKYLDFIYNALDDNVTEGILYKRYTNDTLSENREKTRNVP